MKNFTNPTQKPIVDYLQLSKIHPEFFPYKEKLHILIDTNKLFLDNKLLTKWDLEKIYTEKIYGKLTTPDKFGNGYLLQSFIPINKLLINHELYSKGENGFKKKAYNKYFCINIDKFCNIYTSECKLKFKYHNLYEIVRDNVPQKLVFDIDAKFFSLLNKNKKQINFNDVPHFLNELTTNISIVSNNIITFENLIIFSSHSYLCEKYENIIDKKLSFHILVNGIYVDNNLQNKSFFNAVYLKMSPKYREYLDGSIYSANHQLRMFNSCKITTNRYKYLDELSGWKPKAAKTDTIAYEKEILLASLITYTEGCTRIEVVDTKLATQRIVNQKLCEDELKIPIDMFLKYEEEVINNDSDNITFLNTCGCYVYMQAYDYYCEICNNEHEKHPMCFSIQNKEVRKRCRRFDVKNPNILNRYNLIGILENTSIEETLSNSNTINDDTMNIDTINDDTINVDDNTINVDAINDDTINIDTINDDIVNADDNTINSESKKSFYEKKTKIKYDNSPYNVDNEKLQTLYKLKYDKIDKILKEKRWFQNIDENTLLTTEEKFIFNICQQVKKFTFCKKYCGSIPNKKIVVVKSGLGSGKTTSFIEIIIENFLNHKSIIIVTARIAFANFICKLINDVLKLHPRTQICASLKNYFVDYSKTTSSTRFNSDYFYLIISVESLYRIEKEKYNICIFDEINAVIKEFGSIFNSKNLITNRNIFNSLVKLADRNIFLDGDINHISLEFIRKCAEEINTDIYYIENTYKSHTDLIYYYYQDQESLLLVIKELLLKQKRLYITVCSAEYGKIVEEYIKQLNIMDNSKLLYIYNDGNDYSKIFSNPNNEIIKYDVLIASPKLGMGLSFDIEHYHLKIV